MGSNSLYQPLTLEEGSTESQIYYAMSSEDLQMMKSQIVALNSLGNDLLTIEGQAFANVDFTTSNGLEQRATTAVFNFLKVSNEQEMWDLVGKPYNSNIVKLTSLLNKYSVQDIPKFISFAFAKQGIIFTPISPPVYRINKCFMSGFTSNFFNFLGDAAMCMYTGPAMEVCGAVMTAKFIVSSINTGYGCLGSK